MLIWLDTRIPGVRKWFLAETTAGAHFAGRGREAPSTVFERLSAATIAGTKAATEPSAQ